MEGTSKSALAPDDLTPWQTVRLHVQAMNFSLSAFGRCAFLATSRCRRIRAKISQTIGEWRRRHRNERRRRKRRWSRELPPGTHLELGSARVRPSKCRGWGCRQPPLSSMRVGEWARSARWGVTLSANRRLTDPRRPRVYRDRKRERLTGRGIAAECRRSGERGRSESELPRICAGRPIDS